MNDVWALIVVALPLIGLLVAAVIEIARRNDLTGLWKLLWMGALVLIPIFGLAFYIVVRPPHAEQLGGLADASNAEAIVLLAERRQRDELTDADYHDQLADIATIV